jgi:hypothetical protein
MVIIEKLIVTRQVEKFPDFLETEASKPCTHNVQSCLLGYTAV